MKIYTKTGDRGETSLIGGTRVSKADLRLETYGTADELNAFVGLLRAAELPEDLDKKLHRIQNRLFDLGAYLATDTNKLSADRFALPKEEVEWLEKGIDEMEEGLPALKNFVLPAGNERIARAHVCRTVARRLERQMVALLKEDENDQIALQYVNRLSDFFFVLARKVAQIDGSTVFLWEK